MLSTTYSLTAGVCGTVAGALQPSQQRTANVKKHTTTSWTVCILLSELLITHAEDRCRVKFSQLFVCMSVFQHNISKTDAAKITKLDTNFTRYSPFLGSNGKRWRSQVTRTVLAMLLSVCNE